jgi:hypothetical protein
MHHPLLITALETTVSAKGADNTLVLSSPFGTTYRVQLDPVSANNFRVAIANESKLVAAMMASPHKCDESCDRNDDDDEPPIRYPGNRISKN